jgi:hypothetical protein
MRRTVAARRSVRDFAPAFNRFCARPLMVLQVFFAEAIVMETGKVLDEACNCYNDVYSDEVLYAAWVEAPRIESDPHSELAPAALPRPDLDALMARLYAHQK